MTTQLFNHSLSVRHRNEPCRDPVEPPSLSETRTVRLAEQFKAVSDPTRLRILDLLAQQGVPLCACDITPLFPQNQPTISHHLRLLREAGLIGTEKQGIWAYYWVTELGRRCLDAMLMLG